MKNKGFYIAGASALLAIGALREGTSFWQDQVKQKAAATEQAANDTLTVFEIITRHNGSATPWVNRDLFTVEHDRDTSISVLNSLLTAEVNRDSDIDRSNYPVLKFSGPVESVRLAGDPKQYFEMGEIGRELIFCLTGKDSTSFAVDSRLYEGKALQKSA